MTSLVRSLSHDAGTIAESQLRSASIKDEDEENEAMMSDPQANIRVSVVTLHSLATSLTRIIRLLSDPTFIAQIASSSDIQRSVPFSALRQIQSTLLSLARDTEAMRHDRDERALVEVIQRGREILEPLRSIIAAEGNKALRAGMVPTLKWYLSLEEAVAKWIHDTSDADPSA